MAFDFYGQSSPAVAITGVDQTPEEKAVTQPNAPPVAPQDTTQGFDPYAQSVPAVHITGVDPPIEEQGPPAPNQSYGQSFVKGLTKGFGSNPPMTGFEPPEWQEGLAKSYAAEAAKSPEQKEKELNAALPNAATDYGGKVAERMGEHLPIASVFGPSAVAGQAASDFVGEFLHRNNPDHPVANAGAELLSGLLVAPFTNILTKTLRSVPEYFGALQSPVNKLYNDVGVISRVAGANDGPQFLQQTQNALRENIGSRGTIKGAEDQLFDDVERKVTELADTLGPDVSPFELGRRTQQAIEGRIPQLQQEIGNLSNALSATVPRATAVTPTNYFNTLASLEGRFAGAPAEQKLFQGNVNRYIDTLLTDLTRRAGPGKAMGDLPYDTLQNMRTRIGEMIETAPLNPDVSTIELRALYKGLSEDMRSAYTTPRAQALFDHVNSLQEVRFNQIDQLQKAVGQKGNFIPPELTGQRLVTSANKGASLLKEVVGTVEHYDPSIRGLYASQLMRSWGENAQGEFSPVRFYNNFAKVMQKSPETIDFLFQGNAQAKAGVQKLAELSGLVKGSFESAQTPGTAPNLHLMTWLSRAVTGLATMGGAAVGAGLGKVAGDEVLSSGTSMGMGALTGYSLAPYIEPPANWALAKLWTSPAFNTWLATEGTQLNPRISGLAAIVAQEPDMADALKVLGHSFKNQAIATGKGVQSLLPGEIKRADGGFVEWKQKYAPHDSGKDYDLRGAYEAGIKPDPGNGHFPDTFKKPNHETFSDESKFSKENPDLPAGHWGGPNHDIFQPPGGYALGGLTDTANLSILPTEKGGKDKSTSQEDQATMMHNKQAPPDIAREMMLMMGNQGYAEGGEVEDNASILDRVLGNWRGFGDRDNVRSWMSNLPHYNLQTDPRMEIDPAESNTDTHIRSSYDPFNFLEEKENNGPVYPRQSFSDAINDKTTSYAEGGNVVANENEPPGSLIDQFLNHNSSVIPFKTGAAGKYNNQDFMGYHMGNASDPKSGTTMGFMDSVTPKDVLNYNPQKANTIWGNDMPVETKPPANSNRPLPVDDWSAIDDFAKNPWNGMAQGGAVDDDRMLNQIAYRESAFRNVMNYINDPKHTAGGLYQITNTTWKSFAPGSILSHWSRAIDAPPEVQREVAKIILHSPGGIHHWMNYNPKLRADIQSGNYGNFDSQMANLKGSSEGATNDLPNTELEPQAETPQEIQQDRPSQPSILEAVLSDNPLAQQLVRTIRET